MTRSDTPQGYKAANEELLPTEQRDATRAPIRHRRPRASTKGSSRRSSGSRRTRSGAWTVWHTLNEGLLPKEQRVPLQLCQPDKARCGPARGLFEHN